GGYASQVPLPLAGGVRGGPVCRPRTGPPPAPLACGRGEVSSTQILIIVFGPLLAAIIAGLGNRMLGNVVAKSLTTGALFVSMFLSWSIFLSFVAGDAETTVVPVMKWVESGALSFDWALRVDALTAVMLVVINTVSALVHLYSWGYMAEDDSQPRFFAYL